MTVGEQALLERIGELDQLEAQIELAARGEGRLVVVEGPAGIGKSRLLAEAKRAGERSMRGLVARGSELEREFAFGVVRQLFEADVAERGEALLAGAAAPAAAIFGAPESGVGSDEGASFASLHGLFWLALNLAEERPLLLVIDDLHWCDRPSLLFLAYLARRLEGQPILVLAGLRDAEKGADAALLGELAHGLAAEGIRLGPFSGVGVAAFVEERLGEPPQRAFTVACQEATGGNPLLVTQLVSALRDEGVRPEEAEVERVREIGPRAASRTVLMRLARLPSEAQAIARAVAVLGDGASLAVVSELAAIEKGLLPQATRALARAEILRPDLPLAFVHPLVRDAVYHELSPGDLELEHGRAAVLLHSMGAPTEQVAAQLLHTSPSPTGQPWAGDLLREAGRAAMQTGAVDSAVTYLRRALDESPAERSQLLFELGAAEALTNGPAAAEHLTLAYEGLSDPALRAAAAAALGRTLLFMGLHEQASQIARRAAAELPAELDDARLGLEAFELITAFFGAGEPERLSRLREHRMAPEGGAGSCMLASVAAWQAVGSDGTAAEAGDLALAALANGRLIAADPTLMSFPAILALVVADRPEAEGLLAEALENAYRRGSLLSVASTRLWYGFAALRRGDLAEAEEALRATESEQVLWGHAGSAMTVTRCFLAEALHERGRSAEAFALLERIGPEDPGANTTGWWLGTRAALLNAAGDPEEAVAAADALGAHCATRPEPGRLWWRSLKAEALDRLDRREEAIDLAREELAVTRAFGAPAHLGRTLRVLALLEGEAGLENLREAAAVLESSTARLEHAKALAALGSALRQAGRQSEGREPLRRALELAGACEADSLYREVRAELRASGARPRSDALGGVASLTASERRIVDLAAAGRTNREIAQELYVTPKTVEVHLTNSYRKLDIRSRRELAGVLADV